jgi:desulfoferrodoxin (superoxide reductase-like protein)
MPPHAKPAASMTLKKRFKRSFHLTAFFSLFLLLTFSPAPPALTMDLEPSFRDSTGNTVVIPNRPIVLIQKPGIWQHVVDRHTPVIKTRIRRDGLEMTRIMTVRLPEPVKEDQKDKITKAYVVEKDGVIVGFYQFEIGEQEAEMAMTAVINYVQVYVECAAHGLWRQDLRFSSKSK